MVTRNCSNGRPQRSIHFPENENDLATVLLTIESVDDISPEQKSNLWFSRSDYHFSRSSARVIAKESERYGHSKHLDDTYVVSFDQEVQDKLNLWALHGSSRRGLERWANSSHGSTRQNDQYMYVNGVIRAQTEMKLMNTSKEESSERLRQVGEVLSRKARTFAEMLGAADAESAKWEFGMKDAAAPALSPRSLVKDQGTRKNLGLGGPVGGLAARRPASRRSLPSIQQNLQGVANTRRRASTSTVDANTSARQAPILPINTRPGRVPRMA